jgi:hypothetical protein
LSLEAGLSGAAFQDVQLGLSLGPGIGGDFYFGPYVFVGFETRMLFFMFGDPDGQSRIEAMENALWGSFTFFKIGARIPLSKK